MKWLNKNYLVVVLDAVRYDKFVEAQTPNINALGPTQKVYSAACWTLPSMMNLLIMPCHIGGEPFMPHNAPYWIPEWLRNEHGYYCVFLNGNPWIQLYKQVFSRGFHEFIYCKFEEAITACLERIINTPWFMLMVVIETHNYGVGVGWPKHIGKIEYVDGELGKLFNALDNTVVVVTSDHGETEQGHDPRGLKQFSKDVFEVPFIKGEVHR